MTNLELYTQITNDKRLFELTKLLNNIFDAQRQLDAFDADAKSDLQRLLELKSRLWTLESEYNEIANVYEKISTQELIGYRVVINQIRERFPHISDPQLIKYLTELTGEFDAFQELKGKVDQLPTLNQLRCQLK
jgi:chromosome segregation ATPase